MIIGYSNAFSNYYCPRLVVHTMLRRERGGAVLSNFPVFVEKVRFCDSHPDFQPNVSELV